VTYQADRSVAKLPYEPGSSVNYKDLQVPPSNLTVNVGNDKAPLSTLSWLECLFFSDALIFSNILNAVRITFIRKMNMNEDEQLFSLNL